MDLRGHFPQQTYTYDEKSRVIQRSTRTGSLGEDRTTSRYDERDNLIEQTTENRERELDAGESGALRFKSERSHTQHTRFEYQYDAEGNWTERVVWSRLEPNPDFQRSNIERREISYYIGARTR